MLMLEKMTVLFLLMFIGWLMVKLKVISNENCKVLSAIVINIATPAMILSACVGGESTIKGKDLINTVVVAGGIYLAQILMAQMIPKLLKVDKKDEGCYKLMTIFSNIGFMGFPLVQALYGSEALLYAAVFQIPYNLLIYTYGIEQMQSEETVSKKGRLKKALNVGVIACLITIVLYLTEIKLPEVINTTISYLSALTAPLSMLVIGASFTVIDVKGMFTDKRLIVFAVLKLLVIPIIGCTILKFTVANKLLRGVCIIMLATPVGSMTAMFAQQYNKNYELTAKGVALTTLLSVVTIPIIFALFG